MSIFLIGYPDLVKASLSVLREKINLILSDTEPYKEAKNSHDKDEGYLKKLAAYHHDVKCINELIRLLEEISTHPSYQALNPANKIDRYVLADIFKSLGEISKEISDFIKHQAHTKFPEKDLTRALFGGIKKYRDEIKRYPYIAYDVNNTQLVWMKQELEKALPDLEAFLRDLEAILTSFTNPGQINLDYAEFNVPKVDGSRSEFEKSREEKIKNLTALLNSGITCWKDKVEKIKRRLENLNEQKNEIESELKNLEDEQQPSNEQKQGVLQLRNDPLLSQFSDLLRKFLCNHPYLKELKVESLSRIADDNIKQLNHEIANLQDEEKIKALEEQVKCWEQLKFLYTKIRTSNLEAFNKELSKKLPDNIKDIALEERAKILKDLNLAEFAEQLIIVSTINFGELSLTDFIEFLKLYIKDQKKDQEQEAQAKNIALEIIEPEYRTLAKIQRTLSTIIEGKVKDIEKELKNLLSSSNITKQQHRTYIAVYSKIKEKIKNFNNQLKELLLKGITLEELGLSKFSQYLSSSIGIDFKELSLTKLSEFLKVLSPDKSSEVSIESKSNKKKKLELEIREKQKELKDAEIKLKEQEELTHAIIQPLKTEIQKKPKTDYLNTLNKIQHEIINSKDIKKCEDPFKRKHARKICLGFIGQYFKEIKDDLNKYINQESLFIQAVLETISVRHKHAMHNPLSADDTKIEHTVNESVIPWQTSFEALLTLCEIGDINSIQYKGILTQLEELNPDCTKEQLELRVIHRMIFSLNRLGKYNEAIELFHKIKKLMDDNPSSTEKLLILKSIGDSFYCKGEIKETRDIIDKQIEILETASEFTGQQASNIKSIAFYQKYVCEAILGNSKASHRSLLQAQKFAASDYTKAAVQLGFGQYYMSINKYKDATKVFEGFLDEFIKRESAHPNDCELLFNTLTSLHVCYGELGAGAKSMTALEQADKIIEEQASKFKGLHAEFYNDYKARLYIYKADYYREKAEKLKAKLNKTRNNAKLQKEVDDYYRSGLKWYFEALQLMRMTQKETINLAEVYLQIGNLSRDLCNYTLAKTNLESAEKILIKLCGEYTDILLMGHIKASLACTYKKLKEHDIAKKYHQEALRIFGNKGRDGKYYAKIQIRNWEALHNKRNNW